MKNYLAIVLTIIIILLASCTVSDDPAVENILNISFQNTTTKNIDPTAENSPGTEQPVNINTPQVITDTSHNTPATAISTPTPTPYVFVKDYNPGNENKIGNSCANI